MTQYKNQSLKYRTFRPQSNFCENLAMTTPRRRLVRPPIPPANERQIQKARIKLDRERTGLVRWMSRLKRAFNAVQKQQQRIGRLERRIRQLETT
jgi:hypothetical protein